MRDLLTAPWANQTVGSVARFLALVFVLCGLFALSAGVYFTVTEGFPTDMPLQFFGVMASSLYILAIFLFVAIKGRAPSGWLPWK
jgi:phosphate/sulfate permease